MELEDGTWLTATSDRQIAEIQPGATVKVLYVEDGGRKGVQVVARDAGPGIPDIDQAMADGYSTYDGLGIGLPGARRLMDEFAIVSQTGRGTTITMTMWCKEGQQ